MFFQSCIRIYKFFYSSFVTLIKFRSTNRKLREGRGNIIFRPFQNIREAGCRYELPYYSWKIVRAYGCQVDLVDFLFYIGFSSLSYKQLQTEKKTRQLDFYSDSNNRVFFINFNQLNQNFPGHLTINAKSWYFFLSQWKTTCIFGPYNYPRIPYFVLV